MRDGHGERDLDAVDVAVVGEALLDLSGGVRRRDIARAGSGRIGIEHQRQRTARLQIDVEHRQHPAIDADVLGAPGLDAAVREREQQADRRRAGRCRASTRPPRRRHVRAARVAEPRTCRCRRPATPGPPASRCRCGTRPDTGSGSSSESSASSPAPRRRCPTRRGWSGSAFSLASPPLPRTARCDQRLGVFTLLRPGAEAGAASGLAGRSAAAGRPRRSPSAAAGPASSSRAR